MVSMPTWLMRLQNLAVLCLSLTVILLGLQAQDDRDRIKSLRDEQARTNLLIARLEFFAKQQSDINDGQLRLNRTLLLLEAKRQGMKAEDAEQILKGREDAIPH